MGQFPSRRIDPSTIAADQIAEIAVQSFADFNPANRAYHKDTLAEKRQAMEAARVAEVHAQNTLNAARDAATAAEWDFHNTMLGVKNQVIAQYGNDSDQVQSLGLKKKSDRKRPSVRPRRKRQEQPEPAPDSAR